MSKMLIPKIVNDRTLRDPPDAEDRAFILERDGFKGRLCGCKLMMSTKLGITHTVPRPAGGHTLANLQATCRSCASARAGKLAEEAERRWKSRR